MRFGGDTHETRIVVDLDRQVSAQVSASDKDPTSLDISLSHVGASGVMQGRGQGLVKAWMVENGIGGARLALELTQGAEVRRRFLLPPADGNASYRYVIDIAARAGTPTTRVASAERRAPAAAPEPVAESDTPTPVSLPLKRVIVIDAGHGGHDPGAQSADHNEKDLTLAAARLLKARLERGGRYQVVMTRDADVYVPLDARVQIARKAGADLFISLHADSGPDGTHGASIYTLSERGGSRVNRVLGSNEWFRRTSNRADDPAVGDILLDLTQRSTRNRSATFAQVLVNRVGDQVDLLPRSHRDAGYFVLLAPDVPAALLEMGFITSPEDEARLTDPKAEGQLMDAVADAIDSYFTGQGQMASRAGGRG